MIRRRSLLNSETAYVGYAYSYPHKSAYRSLADAVPLQSVWETENRDSLFLYLHVPFCEFRCGFCNLFTLANADVDLPAKYLNRLRVEARIVKEALSDARFTQVAIGGGTPTFFDDRELAELLSIGREVLDDSNAVQGTSCEASPATLTPSKAKLLREWGATRLSLGVQSFDESESRALGRPQKTSDVVQAIAIAREQNFPTLNLDLIYGLEGQSLASWLSTVKRAVEFRPEEIYLYPLYIRELTGLGKTGTTASDRRLEHYRAARDLLCGEGYEQKSLRMFALPPKTDKEAGVYRCQTDGMVGLGCGARSYTRDLHYSTEFAVGRAGVRSILGDYLKRGAADFASARHGIAIDAEEQRRRFVIQTLLQADGLDRVEYGVRFGADPLDDLPQLGELVELEYAITSPKSLRLTATGLERSDAIGPWLYSDRVRRLMEEFECH